MSSGDGEEKKSNLLLIPPTLQRVLPRTIIGLVTAQNKDSADWAWQGFIAYGSQSSVVVVDPTTLQCIQTLNDHSYTVTKVKWRKTGHYHQTSSPYTLILASADINGNICVWNVSQGTTITTLQDGNRPILDMEWLENFDECEHLLAALHPPYSLVLWNTKHGTKIWKKSYTETLLSFQFDPFHTNKMAYLCQGCILLVEDFNASRSPSSNGNRFFVSVPNQSPSQTSEDKASLRKRVRELVSGETKSRADEPSSECQQLLYHRTIHDQVVLLYPKEVLILDLVINQTVGVISFERSMSNLIQVLPCWQRDVIYCLHESGTVSCHVRRQQNVVFNSKDQTNLSKDDSVSEMCSDLIYDKKCHSEPLRLNKSNRPMSFLVDPVSEKQICLVLGDGRLVFKELLVSAIENKQNTLDNCSSELNELTLKDDHFSPGLDLKLPPLSLSQVIPSTYETDAEGELCGSPKRILNARLMMSGLMPSLCSPLIIRMCPPLTTRNLNVYIPLIAVGTASGTVQVLNLATGVIHREFSLHTYPVRGVEWTSLTSFLSFGNQPLTNSQGRVRNELIHTDTKTGYSITLRANKTEESPIEMLRISYLKQYFIVVLKDDPFELWDCQTLTPLRTMPRKFPKVSALEWSPTTHVKARKDSESKKDSDSLMTTSMSKEDLQSLSRKSSVSDCGGKAIIKENLVFTDIQGQLYRFSVEGNVIKDGNKNVPDPQMNLITGIARKSNDIVMSDSDGVLAILDLKSRTSKHVNTHRGWIKKLRFAPGKDNMKLLVLYADGVDIWDIREVILVAQLKNQKSMGKVLDIDWGASDRPVLATIDGGLRIMDLHLKNCTSTINSYFNKEAIVSPYLMNSEAALNLRTLMIHQNWRSKYSLTFSTQDGFEESQLKMVQQWISRLSPDVVNFLKKSESLSQRAIVVALLFGDKNELLFWTIVAFYLTNGRPPLNLDTSFHHLCDNALFKVHELERLLLHESKDVGGALREELGRRLAVIGERDRVVRLLLDEDPLKPQFYTDCLRACLLSATHHSTQAQSTIKLVATNLIAAGNIWEGIELLCMIGKSNDACRYLQSYGHWDSSIWLAKCVLSQEESLDLVKRFANHLHNTSRKDLGVCALVSIRSVDQAVEQLVNLHYHQRAALLLEAVKEVNESNQPNEKQIHTGTSTESHKVLEENIYRKYVLFLYGLGNQPAVEYFCARMGKTGKILLHELEALE